MGYTWDVIELDESILQQMGEPEFVTKTITLPDRQSYGLQKRRQRYGFNLPTQARVGPLSKQPEHQGS
jgi:hypothetical protein